MGWTMKNYVGQNFWSIHPHIVDKIWKIWLFKPSVYLNPISRPRMLYKPSSYQSFIYYFLCPPRTLVTWFMVRMVHIERFRPIDGFYMGLIPLRWHIGPKLVLKHRSGSKRLWNFEFFPSDPEAPYCLRVTPRTWSGPEWLRGTEVASMSWETLIEWLRSAVVAHHRRWYLDC
jgi:hypothetical protein